MPSYITISKTFPARRWKPAAAAGPVDRAAPADRNRRTSACPDTSNLFPDYTGTSHCDSTDEPVEPPLGIWGPTGPAADASDLYPDWRNARKPEHPHASHIFARLSRSSHRVPPQPPVEGGPPVPTHPIVIPPDEIVPAPPTAEHPIYWPIHPDNTLPDVPGTEPPVEPPLVIWGRRGHGRRLRYSSQSFRRTATG